jgi:hypothetical protein
MLQHCTGGIKTTFHCLSSLLLPGVPLTGSLQETPLLSEIKTCIVFSPEKMMVVSL